MKKIKILEIGPYPPPNSGWSVRIKHLKEGFIEKGYDCQVLNLGGNRTIKSDEYIDVQSGFDFIIKLFKFRIKGYQFHLHTNGDSVKGPILTLTALFISLITFKLPFLTFHAGVDQPYFPREKATFTIYGILYIIFLFSKTIICNNEPVKEKIRDFGPFFSAKKIFSIPAFSVQYLKYQEVALPAAIDSYIKDKKHIILCYIVLRNGFFIETLINFLKNIDQNIGTILIGIKEIEDEEIKTAFEEIKILEKNNTILIVQNLNHDQYMTLLNKCHIYLRTPVTDGVASSVMEALSLGIPVLASENGNRPEGVITYDAEDSGELKNKINSIINNYTELTNNIEKPIVKDTLMEEVELIIKSI